MNRVTLLTVVTATLVAGCTSNVTPHTAADMSPFGLRRAALTDDAVQTQLDRKPLAHFPATIAVGRLQSPYHWGYWHGGTDASTQLSSDVASDANLRRLERLPLVSSVVRLNRSLAPGDLTNEKQVREIAAGVHADLLLIYSVDTYSTSNDLMTPLSIVTAGFSPNIDAKATSTASAVLLDVRNGYVYATAEATSDHNQIADFWTCDQAEIDASRHTDREAVTKLLDDFDRAWVGVVNQYADVR